jgi:cAMP phosphodiesterase
MDNLKTAKGEYPFAYTNRHGVNMYKVNGPITHGYLSKTELDKMDGAYIEPKPIKKRNKKEIVAFEGGKDGFKPIYRK